MRRHGLLGKQDLALSQVLSLHRKVFPWLGWFCVRSSARCVAALQFSPWGTFKEPTEPCGQEVGGVGRC